MMPVISQFLLAAGDSTAGSILAKVTVVTALGLAASRLGRGNRAAVRHALLAATFGVTLLLPVGAVLLPPLRVGVPVGVAMQASAPPVLGADVGRSVTTAEA